MTEPEQDEFAALFEASTRAAMLSKGQTIEGTIVGIGAEVALVDVGSKSEAVLDVSELKDEDGVLEAAVGDRIQAVVIDTAGGIKLSRKLARKAATDKELESAYHSKLPVEGVVQAVIKGGYDVKLGRSRAFCPFSQMDVRRAEAPEAYVGRVLQFRISRYGENGRNIVLTRRAILEEQAAAAAEETRKKLVVGAVLPGTVTSLADFGAFVDLGGVQGLVPVSEISHSRVGRPADRLHVGESVTVKVLKVDEAKGKVSLSLKALEGDPWAAVAGQLRERQIVSGRVVRMTDFGVFVELLHGVDGLLHLTEIPRARHAEMKDAAASGAPLMVLVTSIEPERRRIGLALAPEGASPGSRIESDIKVGALVTGTVDRVEPFGVFLRLGPGQVGVGAPNAVRRLVST